MCKNCNNTGRNPGSEFLDCAHCDAATNIAAGRPAVEPGAAPIAAAVPAGCQIVPLEPSEAMLHAAEDVPAPRPYGAVYRAMIAAAPAAPSSAPAPESQPAAPTSSYDFEDQLDRLITDVSNASHACGEYISADAEGYAPILKAAHTAEDKLRNFVRAVSRAALSAPAAPVPAASEGWTPINQQPDLAPNASLAVEFKGEPVSGMFHKTSGERHAIAHKWPEFTHWRPAAPLTAPKG